MPARAIEHAFCLKAFPPMSPHRRTVPLNLTLSTKRDGSRLKLGVKATLVEAAAVVEEAVSLVVSYVDTHNGGQSVTICLCLLSKTDIVKDLYNRNSERRRTAQAEAEGPPAIDHWTPVVSRAKENFC